MLRESDRAASLPMAEGRRKRRLGYLPSLLICFAIAFLLALSRRHDPWYPYAEDGRIFYQQAIEFGLRSLFIPDGGYLHLGLRLMALVLAQFPPSLMPFAMVATTLAIQAALATLIFSDELSNLVPSQFYRALLAFVYIGLPDVDEVYGHFVNVQWHLGILAALLIFARTPSTRPGKLIRLCLIAILSLTGPFMAFLFPLTCYKLFRNRSRYNLGLFLCSLPSLIQFCIILFSGRPTRPWSELLRPMAIIRAIGGRGLLSAAISPHVYQRYWVDEPVLWASTFGVFVLCLYAVVERKRLAALLLYLGACILLTSLRGGVGSIGTLLNSSFSNRYFFTFGFGLLTTVILIVASEKRYVRFLTACCVVALLSISWRLEYPVGFWPKYQAALDRYDQARRGTLIVFPEVPKDWTYQIRKR